MRDILILSERDLRACVALDRKSVEVVEDAFRALATGTVVMPPILSMDLHDANAEVDAKTAYIPGLDGFALKVASGFFDNPAVGLPSLSGLMILFSAKTGLVEAVMLDNGYLTAVRTAAAGAVVAQHLAPEVVEVAGVLGSGEQAVLQIQAALLARSFSTVLVWGRDKAKAEACAAAITAATGVPAIAESDAAKVVRQSQLVVTATSSREPILKRDWLHPGLHITAMGSDMDFKVEIEPSALAAADVLAVDRLTQCAVQGELRAARAAGLLPDDPPELGAVITGAHPGRRSPDDITIADLTGTGAQDTAIATHALKVAVAAGLGSVVQA